MATNPLPFVQTRKRKDGTVLGYRGWVRRGRKRVYSATFRTEKEAYAAHLRMLAEADNDVGAETLDDACKEMLRDVETKRTKGQQRWAADHLRAVRKVIPGSMGLHRITPAVVEQYVRDRLRDWAKRPVTDKDGNVLEPGRHVKPATVNADLRALHRVFALAIRRGVVKENPVRRVDRPREDRPPMDWFTDEEFRALLGRIADERTRDVLTVVALTGLRRSELARVECDHVRFRTNHLVVVGKTGTRVVPLSPDAIDPLKRLIATAKGKPLVDGGEAEIDKLFRDVRRATNERRLHPHALRHTFGTALIRSGVRPDVVMRLMGHRSITTTLLYVHEVGVDGEQAVHSLRLVPRRESGPAQAE